MVYFYNLKKKKTQNKVFLKSLFLIQSSKNKIFKGKPFSRNLGIIKVNTGLTQVFFNISVNELIFLKQNNLFLVRKKISSLPKKKINIISEFSILCVFLLLNIYCLNTKPLKSIFLNPIYKNKKLIGFALLFLGFVIKVPLKFFNYKKQYIFKLYKRISFFYLKCIFKITIKKYVIYYSLVNNKKLLHILYK